MQCFEAGNEIEKWAIGENNDCSKLLEKIGDRSSCFCLTIFTLLIPIDYTTLLHSVSEVVPNRNEGTMVKGQG